MAMSSKITLPSILSESNVAVYMQQVKKFPILSQEEENKLIHLWIKDKNLQAAHKLVTSHLRLVIKMALQFRNYGLPLMDMISEGNIGLMKAVRKFKPEKGNRLSTYAIWWIKASIQEYIIKSWSMVKVSSGILQKKLFSNISKLKDKIKEENDNEIDNIIKNSYQTVSLNERLDNDEGTEFIDTISDFSESHEESFANRQIKDNRVKILNQAINSLNDREQDIIKQRKLSETPVTLEVLSKKYNVSSERVRQIEESALKKIKNFTIQN
jgi:RNA polymerase sigma-32 factor